MIIIKLLQLLMIKTGGKIFFIMQKKRSAMTLQPERSPLCEAHQGYIKASALGMHVVV